MAMKRTTGWTISAVALAALASATGFALMPGFGDGAADVPNSELQAHVASVNADREMSESARAALADGVTFGEYDAAFSNLTACIVSAGAGFAAPPALTSRQIYDFMIILDADGEGLSAADPRKAAVDSCLATVWNPVSDAWVAARQPTHEEVLLATRDIAACMRSLGVDAPLEPEQGWSIRYADPRAEVPADEMHAYFGCALDVFAEMGLPRGAIPMP